MKTRAILISLSVSILSLVLLLNCGDKEKPKEEAPAASAAPALSADLVQGKEIFEQNCVACHGPTGAGDGAAAASLNPKPRNYKAPASEWKNGPTEEGVLKTLKKGLPKTQMVAFEYLGEEKLKLVAKYVVYLNQN